MTYGARPAAEWVEFTTMNTNTTGLSFGDAITALKNGYRVLRAGWKGKGMYLWLLPEAKVPSDWCKEPHLKELAERNPDGSKTMHCLPSIRMKTADGKVLTGWLASQTDMLSDDWQIDGPAPEVAGSPENAAGR